MGVMGVTEAVFSYRGEVESREIRGIMKSVSPMGVDGVLVSFPVFKTECGLWSRLGGFDSHALPPT